MRLSPRLNQHASGVVLGVTQIINGLYNPVSSIVITTAIFFIIIIIIVVVVKASTNLISDRMLFIDVKYDYTITLLRKPILRANIGYKGPWFHSKIKKNSIHNTSMITVAHR